MHARSRIRRFPALGALVFCAVVVVAIAVRAAAPLAQRFSSNISFEPGPFKMVSVGGGGSVPVAGPVIRVGFNQTQRRHTHIAQQPLELRATMIISCAPMKLQGLTMKVLGQQYPVSASGLSNSNEVYTGTKTFETDQLTTAALASAVPDPVAMCNADLDAMLSKGQQSKAEKGWARKYDNALLAEMVASCKGEPTKKGAFEEPPPIREATGSTRFPVWVHCAPAAVPKAGGSSRPIPVKKAGFQSARVFVNPPAHADYRGPCPKEITFGGEIEYLMAPGTSTEVRYRYRTHDGGASPVLSTKITKSGKTNITYWKHEFGGVSPGGGLATPAGGGLPVVDGTVRLEILGSSGDVIDVDQASFKVTCQPKRVSGSSPSQPAAGTLQGPPPSPSPAAAAPRGMQSPAMLPDLVIRAAQPAPRSANVLHIQVANMGKAASQPTTLAVFYERSGQVVKKSFNVPAIGPNQSRRIVADVGMPLAHAARLTARVNDSGGSPESDPANNTFTIK